MEELKHEKNPWVIQKLEQYFYWHGKKIAQRPILFALICVGICGGFSAGLIQYTPEVSPYKLWVPSNSDFVNNTNWLWSTFPPDTRYHSVIITANNVLRPEVLMHVLKVHEILHNIKSPEGRTWSEKCFKIPVVDIRGDDVSESVEEDDEDLLSFEIEDDTSAVDIYEYDFSSFYDTYNSDSEKKISRKRRR